MTHVQLLEVLASRGVTVRLKGETLALEPAESAREFIDDLRRLKPVIVAHLRGARAPAQHHGTPRPLERLLENLKAVHRQLEQDQAHGFILETLDLGVPSKLTVRGIQYQALERAVRSALERTPDAERVIVWTVQPDGWEATCAQYHDGTNSRNRVQA
jgi:hypothetical protein